MSKRGKFIVIEGGEGSGKTSVVSSLKDTFSHTGCIMFTREPGGTKIGEKIRNILLDKDSSEMSDLTELFLFCGARAQHVNELIIPSLKSGKHVISDRFDTSTIAYQLFGRDKLKLLNSFLHLNNIAKQNINPDVVIWLDVTPEIGLLRKEKSQEGKTNRFDEEEIEFHRRVREGFTSCFRKNHTDTPFATAWYKMDTDNKSLDEVKKEVFRIVGTTIDS